MKAAQFIIQQLFNARKVTLRQIGHFYLEADPGESGGSPEEVFVPGKITFIQDARAMQDDALVSYIMQQTGKIRPLATADLESYLELVKQFLNLGKPFIIEGLGVLKKNQNGEVIFQEGDSSLSARPDIIVNDSLRERTSPDISFASVAKKKARITSREWTVAGVIIAVAGLLFFLFSGQNENKKQEARQPMTAIPDTTAKAGESAVPPQIRQTTEDSHLHSGQDSGSTFRIVLKQYSSFSKANYFYNKLKYDHNLSVITNDSITYKVVVNMHAPLSDTVRASDSLYLMLGLPTYYELIQH